MTESREAGKLRESREVIESIDSLGKKTLIQIEQTVDLAALELVRISVLGKKGSLSEILKSLGSLSAEERPKVGAQANVWKNKIETALSQQKEKLELSLVGEKIKQERLDITLPARKTHLGALSPITSTERLIISTFKRLGFDVVRGPEVETDFLNFEAVNIPKDHPARDMQDTFFLGPGVLLRTHTSPVQMRTLCSQNPPIRILCPGAVYRCDDDATHSPMFHQIEGLWVDKISSQGPRVRMSDLKGVLAFFAREIFGANTKVRLRPSYFPFVEPGAEVDVSCYQCHKKINPNCRICKGSGWLEILGAGMVHPELFRHASLEPEQYTGFAFGLGIERIAMLLHQIPDLRLMLKGDVRFSKQFIADLGR